MIGTRRAWSRLISNYGMAGVLFILCVWCSLATLKEQMPAGAAAADEVVRTLERSGRPKSVLIFARDTSEDQQFAARLREVLARDGGVSVETVTGGPPEARAALDARAAAGTPLEVVAATGDAGLWLESMIRKFPSFGGARVVVPAGSTWPVFLRADNLFNVANQIVVYAVIAIGMTMVIITGGIDLSVGSLVAVSAVVTALLIRGPGGGVEAGPTAMVLAALGGIAACAAIGAFSGLMITAFGIPPFIATLGMMLVSSGLAYIVSQGQSIYEIPPSFTWLGRGAGPVSVPNAAILMALLYAAAHVVMSRTRFGRYIYAVGGNAEAARLSGVRVNLILLLVYTLSGAMAGLGGVVVASQLRSGAPQYGQFYELYVIAAVVVGGTSLSGGSGKILGTLIGALIIAVIQNGMNLTDVEPYHQKVVMGLVILGAVLLDRLRKRGFRRRPRPDPNPAG